MVRSLDVDMETEDLINLPASSNVGAASENNSLHKSTGKLNGPKFLPTDTEFNEIELKAEILEKNKDEVSNAVGQSILGSKIDQNIKSTTVMQVSVELNEANIVKEGCNSITPTIPVGNGIAVHHETYLNNHKRNGSSIRSHDIDDVSSVKRPRITRDEPQASQASVHVIYNSLTRVSRKMLEELLQKWSEWHSQHYSSSPDSKDELESGERTYFPALHVGGEKASVSFWIDGETRNLQSKAFVELDNSSIPLYDRGYSFGLTSTDGSTNPDSKGLEIGNAPRCFNCGSYNHSLKECPTPRDNAAVNSARKQLNTRRNKNGISRKPTRYYQDTPGGKFDGLRPGVLNVETRRHLGLGELDPPPWLNRMREIGYPPGYLDPEVEDLPSGITIFGDEEKKINRQETGDGKIFDTEHPDPSQHEPTRKMSVEFPGINAPIPEKADEWRWAAAPTNKGPSRNSLLHHTHIHSTEPISKPLYHEQRWSMDRPPRVDPGSSPVNFSTFSPRFGDYSRNSLLHHTHIHSTEPISKPLYHEQRWSMDGPPRVDPGSSPVNFSTFSPRYGDYYDSIYGRSLSDGGRRSPLFQESSFHQRNYRSDNPGNGLWGGLSPPGVSSYRKDMQEANHRFGKRYGDYYDSRSPIYEDRSLSDGGRRSPLFQESSFHQSYYRSDNPGNDLWGGLSPPGVSSYREDMLEENHRFGRRY